MSERRRWYTLRFEITLSGEPVDIAISLDYRSSFIHVMKKIADASGLYDYLYGEKSHQRFAFSARLGSSFRIVGEVAKAIPPFFINFSSGDLVVFNSFLGTLTRFKKFGESFRIADASLHVSNVTVQRPYVVNRSSLECKTFSHVVLRDPKNPDLCLSPDDSDVFNETLSEYMKKKCEALTGKAPAGDLTMTPVEGKFELIRHYGGFIGGFRGFFTLSGSPDLLQFAYDFGLGQRTGQGFGLFSLVGASL